MNNKVAWNNYLSSDDKYKLSDTEKLNKRLSRALPNASPIRKQIQELQRRKEPIDDNSAIRWRNKEIELRNKDTELKKKENKLKNEEKEIKRKETELREKENQLNMKDANGRKKVEKLMEQLVPSEEMGENLYDVLAKVLGEVLMWKKKTLQLEAAVDVERSELMDVRMDGMRKTMDAIRKENEELRMEWRHVKLEACQQKEECEKVVDKQNEVVETLRLKMEVLKKEKEVMELEMEEWKEWKLEMEKKDDIKEVVPLEVALARIRQNLAPKSREDENSNPNSTRAMDFTEQKPCKRSNFNRRANHRLESMSIEHASLY